MLDRLLVLGVVYLLFGLPPPRTLLLAGNLIQLVILVLLVLLLDLIEAVLVVVLDSADSETFHALFEVFVLENISELVSFR